MLSNKKQVVSVIEPQKGSIFEDIKYNIHKLADRHRADKRCNGGNDQITHLYYVMPNDQAFPTPPNSLLENLRSGEIESESLQALWTGRDETSD